MASCAADHGVHVVVFPELSLTGYEPTIAAETAIEASDPRLDALQGLSNRRNVTIIAGCAIRSRESKPYIGAVIVRPELPIEIYRKRFMHPDEFRWFIPSDDVAVFRCHGREIGVAICADISNPVHAADTFRSGATFYAASVMKTPEGGAKAEFSLSQYAREYGFPAALANYATESGGFATAGRSAIWDEHGDVIARAPESGECVVIAEVTPKGWRGQVISLRDWESQNDGSGLTHFETYTPGHSQNSTEFMLRRSLDTHGEFFLPFLKTGVSVLDCGCGPGSITLDIADKVAPAQVVGIDFAESQIKQARLAAEQRGCDNVRFEACDVYSLPFDDNRFDRVFSHALLEHLADPVEALRELFRVLKPGGVIGVCSPDWNGFVFSPPSEELDSAMAAYTRMQTQNGGDVNVGSKFGLHLAAGGFEDLRMSARYEVYPEQRTIAEYLALQLDLAGDENSASTFRTWGQQPGGMFAQSWVSCVANKPL